MDKFFAWLRKTSWNKIIQWHKTAFICALIIAHDLNKNLFHCLACFMTCFGVKNYTWMNVVKPINWNRSKRAVKLDIAHCSSVILMQSVNFGSVTAHAITSNSFVIMLIYILLWNMSTCTYYLVHFGIQKYIHHFWYVVMVWMWTLLYRAMWCKIPRHYQHMLF